MATYVPTIGLEIHAELKTQTKMFCRSKNDPDETRPNVNICPVCLAHPGTLPVINREAIKHVLRVGTALGASLADYTEFDRKNYFYPDLPKGYQLSQYEYPLVSGGELAGVAITRVHLEEDTASSVHDGSGKTLVDYNRAGVPLMELVTEPVISSAELAGRFARELQMLLRYLGASDANMQKGEMRVEANVSVAQEDDHAKKKFGTKVEIKNLNSFRAMERAVAYEINRQTQLLESGGSVVQETRGWDEGKQATFSQRIKEESADYRYFPDPDLPSLRLSEIADFDAETLARSLPELPWQRKDRYVALGIKQEDAESFVRDTVLGRFFEEVIEGYDREGVRMASNYVANDLVSLIRRDADIRDTEISAAIPISARYFKNIIDMLLAKSISSRTAKDLLVRSIQEGKDPITIANEENLMQETDTGAIMGAVERVIAAHAKVVDDYRAGKTAALQYLVGQCMKELRGAADAETVRKVLLGAIG